MVKLAIVKAFKKVYTPKNAKEIIVLIRSFASDFQKNKI